MRLGIRTPNEFIQDLNLKNDLIQKKFLEKIQSITNPLSVMVMLGDSTIIEQKTFDPIKIQNFYQEFIKKLKDWAIQDVSTSNNEDLRRIFVKFQIKEGNYLISGHASVQYHVLLYYRTEHEVIETQKELSEIIELTKTKEHQRSDDNDQLVLDKLREKGYKDFNHQKLFEIFFENDKLREQIVKEIEENSDTNFEKLTRKKEELISKLDNLLVETYQTSGVLIDDAKLITGEEGCLFTIDIEFVKNEVKEGLFDPRKIPDLVKKKIAHRIDEILECL